MAVIKAIFFDFYGVLATVDFPGLHDDLCKAMGIDREAFRQIHEKHLPALATGKMKQSTFTGMVERRFKVSDLQETWDELFLKERKLNKGMFALAKKLRKHYVVGMISGVPTFQMELNQRDGLYALFDPVVLSCIVGYRKTHKKLYQAALKQTHFQARECVMIDDFPFLLKVAKSLGFKGILFENAKQTEKALKKLGVKVKS